MERQVGVWQMLLHSTHCNQGNLTTSQRQYCTHPRATLGEITASALGCAAALNAATGVLSAPSYSIAGQSYGNIGAAFEAIDEELSMLDTRLGTLSEATELGFWRANGGIATALALGVTMIVPDSAVSASFSLATYRGEQGFSGSLVVPAAPKVYISGGFAGSTVEGSTGGRVGVSFGSLECLPSRMERPRNLHSSHSGAIIWMQLFQ